MKRNIVATAATMAALALGAAIRTTADAYQLNARVIGGQPWRGDAGMAHGTKNRGNRRVLRAAQKRRNVARNRLAHRG